MQQFCTSQLAPTVRKVLRQTIVVSNKSQHNVLPDKARFRASYRAMSSSSVQNDPFRPAKRVAGQKQDVW